jgi:benzoylformate decarboxylase
MQTVRSVTFELLRAVGATTIFGNPGSTEAAFLKNFPDDFRYVLALQEASAMAMADGFAQATGRLTLVNLHTSAGLGHAMGNLMTASLNKTPLIVTAGQQTREMLLMEPWLTNVEATMLPRPYVKWAYEPARAEDVPAAFMRAFATALQPPQGPVFLSLPVDDWDKSCAGPAEVRTVSPRFAPDPLRLAEFAKALSEASSPVLIYGAAVDRGGGWSEGIALAESLGAPVWTAPACERAPFPENHPLYAGRLPFAIGALRKSLEGHDVALVVGASVFRYYIHAPGPYLPDGMRLLHISDDPAETARAPVGDSLLGDAALSLAALKNALGQRKRGSAAVQVSRDARLRPVETRGTGLTAAHVFRALSEIRPTHALMVAECPSAMGDLHAFWPITEPASFFTSASGGLGWSLPASVGIALGERDSGRNRPVIMVIGDGSFQYSLQAIWTAAQLQLPILIVVLRNEQYGVLKSYAALAHTPGVPGLDLPGLDAVSLAKGYGCDAARLDDADAIKRAASEAWTKARPTVLEIPLSPEIPTLAT